MVTTHGFNEVALLTKFINILLLLLVGILVGKGFFYARQAMEVSTRIPMRRLTNSFLYAQYLQLMGRLNPHSLTLEGNTGFMLLHNSIGIFNI